MPKSPVRHEAVLPSRIRHFLWRPTFSRLFQRRSPPAAVAQGVEPHRTEQQLREHYLVEVELGNRLKNASQAERRRLYAEVYNELYARVPHHPSLIREEDPDLVARRTGDRFAQIAGLLKNSDDFLEVGAGDCRLAIRAAETVRSVTVVEVSEETGLKHLTGLPVNFHSILSDGVNVTVANPGEYTVAYSGDVIEHLHPDDVVEQLRDIYRALAPGGIYICVTPHRYEGPTDISKYFDDEPKGLHLKEYTNGELATLFRNAGFRRVRCRVLLRKHGFQCPVWPIACCERLMSVLPHRWRRWLALRLPLRPLLRICIVGTK
jgi:SAM-dependent methyltransferase